MITRLCCTCEREREGGTVPFSAVSPDVMTSAKREMPPLIIYVQISIITILDDDEVRQGKQ